MLGSVCRRLTLTAVASEVERPEFLPGRPHKNGSSCQSKFADCQTPGRSGICFSLQPVPPDRLWFEWCGWQTGCRRWTSCVGRNFSCWERGVYTPHTSPHSWPMVSFNWQVWSLNFSNKLFPTSFLPDKDRSQSKGKNIPESTQTHHRGHHGR